MVEGVGGSLECFYFAWGDVDAYVIVDVPSDEVMASIALSVNQSGASKHHHGAAADARAG